MLNALLKRIILLVVVSSGLISIGQLIMISQVYYDGAILRASNGTNPWQPDGALISVVDADSSLLQDDDRLVAINEYALSEWVDRLFCWFGQCDRLQVPVVRDGTNLTYTIIRDGNLRRVEVSLRPYPFRQIIMQAWGGLGTIVITYLLFLVLWIKQPDESAIQAMALSASGFVVSLRWHFGLTIFDILTIKSFWWFHVATQVFYILGSISFFHFALVFPRPLPLIARNPHWRVLLYPITYLIYGTALTLYALTTPNKLLWLGHSNTVATWLDTFTPIGSVLAIGINYRSLKRGTERQHIRIVLFAILVVMFLALALLSLPELLFGEKLISDNLFSVIGLIIPLTIIFAIQRHRLWNIDPLINRALVYLSLSAIILSVYMIVVALSGEFLRRQTDPVSGLIATGFVVVIFQPLRQQLQKIVNRIMYGERDDPAAVLTRLAHHLEKAETPTAILPNLVQTIAHLLKIPYVAIWLPVAADQMEPVAVWGKSADAMQTHPLMYQKEAIGHLVVAPRGPQEQFNRHEQELLATIAALTATTVRAVQLSDELRRSRQRIVTAREEERRRLRRDLHDGLGPQLASQTLGLEAVAQLMPTNPEKAQALLESLKAQAQDAILDVRRLIYDLRPPALDDLGLVEALRQSASRYETGVLRFNFDVPQPLLELPAAVETAAYRIAQEAMTNVVRHAHATLCTVCLFCTNTHLVVEVRDNGRGLSQSQPYGVGLQAMKERTTELNGEYIVKSLTDGGTLVQAQLPLEV